MKKNKLIIFLLSIFTFISCDEFLDTLPDKRAELNTPDKIAKVLVSAYPTELPTLMFEIMSDNVTDNGPQYAVAYSEQTVTQSYKYQDITEIDWDVPQRVWQQTYASISSANQALAAIEELGSPEETNGSKAEALLCRAFGHFILVNTFSIAYNSESSTSDLGIPYMSAPETTVRPAYERGTVAQVYELIDRDIEAALPLLKDDFIQPAYHFNTKAAYAFAARFNLFYGKWDKAISYATQAIGENPTLQFRNVVLQNSYSVVVDRTYAYINKDEPANLMILPQRSLWGRVYNRAASGARYAHARTKANYTFWQFFPWNNIANGYSSMFGSNQNVYYPKIQEIFEITNATAQTGQPHTVLVPFTVEETLMCRAEAYIMQNNLDAAVRDLNYWYAYNSPGGSTFTADAISAWYAINSERTPRYKMDTRFNVSEGLQENLLRAVLAIRRINCVHTGKRWLDIKRHGITVEHPVFTSTTVSDTIRLLPYDPRTAIQLPQDVTIGGLPPNPRDDNATAGAASGGENNIMTDTEN
ncbi:MAG: RagB/SusD family nutrient uptake outer membrane protein [Proteiniphilum sp.]|jgi:hypothetical protein|nr:RagB/SusD family nutrient uptake outer membrane protein [Proteiniphilum sp.]